MSMSEGYTPTPYEVEAYTLGDCWHLAKVLSDMTGRPMLTTEFGDEHGDWFHVGLSLPKKMVLDIEGAVKEGVWSRRWEIKARWPEKFLVRNIGKGKDAAPFLTNWCSSRPIHRLYEDVDTHEVALKLLQTHAPELISV